MHHIASERRFQLFVQEATDYAIIITDALGHIVEWSSGAQALFGWTAQEAIGQPIRLIFTEEDKQAGADKTELHTASVMGKSSDVRWHLRKDGTTVFCDGRVNRLFDEEKDALLGFGKIMRAIPAREMADHGQAHVTPADALHAPQQRMAAAEAQDRLQKAEEQLRLATQAAQLGIWTWDVEHDLVNWENERMYEIFNIPPGQRGLSAARLMAEYLHPDDVENFKHARDKTTASRARFYFTGRFYRLPEKKTHWLELTGTLHAGQGQEALVIVGTAADITEHKQAEEAYREARLRSEATLAAAEVASWIWDIPNDRIIADRNLTRLFGVPEELASGAPLARYTAAVHPEDLAEVKRQIQHAIDTKEPYWITYRVTDFQGGYRWVNARGRIEYDEQGMPAILAGVTLDITRQKELKDIWRVTEERYRTLITSIDEAFAIVRILRDEHGRPVDYRFEEVNRAFEQQSGLVNAAGKTIREMVPDIEPHWIDTYSRVAMTRVPTRFVEHSEAMGYWWNVYATPIGEPEECRIAILFTDVTEKKRAEENLHQLAADLSDANRRKMEFLATLAHELRNPLAPVRTGLDLMRMPGKSPQGSSRILDMMDRQVNQMAHLIDDLMDVSRINSGKIVLRTECLDVRDVIANAVESVLAAIESAHHQLDLRLPEQPLMIDADPTRLAQILINLLTNAAKYTPNGGKIVLSARLENDAVLLAVQDTGIGIPKEEQAGVFDMFSQVSKNMGRAQGGLGIGLSLVRSLVAMHGGTIAVSSPGPGAGTTFTVTLPASDDCRTGGASRKKDVEEKDVTAADVLHVIIVDDNIDAAETLGSLLRALGHRIDIVHDGLAAVRKINEEAPDLAILDIGMPGMNGYEVAERIRRMPGMEGIVLVALTGWGGDHDRNRSRAAGFDAHLIKPAGIADLNRLIAQIASKKGQLRH
jgi:PAS domain S-box-containing protein